MITVQNNKQLLKDFFENVVNKRNWSQLHHFVSQNFENAIGQNGVDVFIEPVRSFIHAFPDAQWKIQQIVVEEDRASVSWVVEATNTKPFQGFPPTGKRISGEAIGLFEFEDGKIVKAKVLTDRLGLLHQIDVIPADLSLLHRKEDEKTVNFIDKFFVPATAIQQFEERMRISREFIKTLPGLVNDEVYRRFTENGNLVCITIAKWKSTEALSKAKEAVQAEYKKQNFDPAKMFEELGITLDRNIYKKG